MTQKQWILGTALVFGLAACGDKRSTDMSDDATGAVLGAVGSGMTAGNTMLKATSLKIFTDDTIDESQDCSEGGSVDISGSRSATQSGTTSTISMTVTQTFNDCKQKSEDDVTYTINGDVTLSDVSGTVVIEVSPPSIDLEYTIPMTGTLDVSGGDIEVTDCAIDLTSSLTISGGASTMTVSNEWDGKVCGKSTTGSATVNASLSAMKLIKSVF